MPPRDQTIELISRLVAIDSINSQLVEGGAGEGAIGRFVAAWLEEAGLDVHLHKVAPGRYNIIGRVPGQGRGRSLLINAHMDTVGVAGMDRPFQPRVEGDRLYGRGAFDMKSGLAAAMLAAAKLRQAGGAAGDVTIAAVVDEEFASAGTAALVEAGPPADAAIVTEPTGLRLCVAHRGFAWFTIETRGRAAHGSRPDLGVDAISHMGRVLADLETLGAELASRSPHRLVGTGSIHASLIDGGQELSSYPAVCRLQLERRTVPGETGESVTQELQKLLEARRIDPRFEARLEPGVWRDPFQVDPDERIARAVEAAASAVIGRPPTVYGEAWWMDSALLAAAGIPTVVFGPSGEGAHAEVEWTSLESIRTCARVLERAALDFCGELAKASQTERQ